MWDLMGDIRMLNDFGNLCCLGHISHACGVGEIDLKDTARPDDLIKGDFPFTIFHFLQR